MENPWLNISWKNPIAEADREWIEERFGSVKTFEMKYKTFRLNLYGALPEPYSGNKDSKVYCLNMNPGKWISRFKSNESMLEMTIRNLRHEVENCFWWEKVRDDDGNPHDGYCWLKLKTHLLEETLGCRPNIFFIEFFPYHSKSGFRFPDTLPSYEYSNDLIYDAMGKEKTIIIMRQVERWLTRIPQLRTYSHMIKPKSCAGGWLSPNNLGLKGDNELIRKIF